MKLFSGISVKEQRTNLIKEQMNSSASAFWWFRQLPNQIKLLAISNTPSIYSTREIFKYDSMDSAIKESFDISKSQEGEQFWLDVISAYNNSLQKVREYPEIPDLALNEFKGLIYPMRISESFYPCELLNVTSFQYGPFEKYNPYIAQIHMKFLPVKISGVETVVLNKPRTDE